MTTLKHLLLSTTLALTAFASAAATFGAAVDKTKLVAVADILAKPQSYLQQQVTVKGTVAAVCQKKGCWMQFAADANQPTFRVKVKDGDMVFPVSAKGKTAYASGKLVPIEMDLESSRDYLAHKAEEQGEAFDPNSVTQAITLYQLVPVAVEIAD
jgi:2-keto-4-pentenoate hydratase